MNASVSMHIVGISYFYDCSLTSPDALLARYTTLTDWAEGLAEAGAQVSVVQRFGSDAERTQGGIPYRFVRDPAERMGSLFDRAERINRIVAGLRPDVVHVNGLSFARQAWRLRRLLPQTPMLLQDHANRPPARWLSRVSLRLALCGASAVSFAARAQAEPWQKAGALPRSLSIVTLMEGSSRFRLRGRDEARAETGLTGNPLCLWVGRLNANKDPLTILRGFARALPHLPGARLAMAYGTDDLLPQAQAWLEANPAAAGRVTLLGRVPHPALEAVYNSADLFLLGSHHEGSGYAVLEALACGVVPILTDIPSFRVLTGDGQIGGLWPVGDAAALAERLRGWQARLTPDTPRRVRAFFDACWSVSALGREALECYARLARDARR